MSMRMSRPAVEPTPMPASAPVDRLPDGAALACGTLTLLDRVGVAVG